MIKWGGLGRGGDAGEPAGKPVPKGVLIDPLGENVELSSLQRDRPALLVFASPDDPTGKRAMSALPTWAARLPRVHVVAVVPDQASAMTYRGRGFTCLVDKRGKVKRLFGGSGSVPVAVLLHRGVQVRPPVEGRVEIEEFVAWTATWQVENADAAPAPTAHTPTPGTENEAAPYATPANPASAGAVAAVPHGAPQAPGGFIDPGTSPTPPLPPRAPEPMLRQPQELPADPDRLAISCLYLTRGWEPALEEALQAFLDQQYPGAHELVIVNDDPSQWLSADQPRVRVVNLDFGFRTLGEQLNLAVSAARFDTLAAWDSGGIALPQHLDTIDHLIRGYGHLRWERAAVLTGDAVTGIEPSPVSGMVFGRASWRSAGGAGFDDRGWEGLKERLEAAGVAATDAAPGRRFVTWVRRATPAPLPGPDVPTGQVPLTPRRQHDHAALLAAYCDQQGY